MPDAPALVTIPGVPLIDVGTWAISTGEWSPTTADLHAAVAALDCPAVRRPVLKIGHEDARFAPGDGEPALGWVDNLTVSSDGQRLTGDYTAVPSWLGTANPDGHSVLASAYPDRSVEGEYRYACALGHRHDFVLSAVALLGVTPPGVGTLGSLHDLASMYGIAAAADHRRDGVVTARINTRTPVAAAAGNTHHQDGGPTVELSPEQASSLRAHYGLTDDASIEDIVGAALTGATTVTPPDPERDPLTETPGVNPPVESTPDEVVQPPAAAPATATTPAIPEGSVLVDAEQWADMKIAAAAGREAREHQLAQEKDGIIAAAISEGRIPPSRRAFWRSYLDRDTEGGRQVLASFEAGSAVPLTPTGHGAAEVTPTDDTGEDYYLSGFAINHGGN